jgi:murein DD-endopeptidase MepM/ murein hydrolase activator NlpD
MSPFRPLLLAVAVALGALLPGQTFGRGPVTRGVAVPPVRIVFPIVGQVQFYDDFGEARGQGKHEANDILAERKAPVVAVEDGTVKLWTTSPSAGCMLYLYGRSGTTYLYIHLNNDLGTTNDNRGACVPGIAYAPELHDGQQVRAGELIGFVGDSGDADGLHPHLHFELHPGGGEAVSPYPWLLRARHLLQPEAGALPIIGGTTNRPLPDRALLGE